MEKEQFTQFNYEASQADKDYAKGICQEILQQIKLPNKWIYFSWGASKFVYGVSEQGNPILRFKVNGRKFKGYVHIIYNPMDWYDIEFVSTHNNLKNRIEEVYCDNLQEKIDDYVEKIEEYAF